MQLSIYSNAYFFYTCNFTKEMEMHKHVRKQKDNTRQTAFQEAAVFDYKGISNPVSLSCFLYSSV